MTMFSLNAPQPEYRQPVSTRLHDETPDITRESETGLLHHACEIQRMKAFAGRHRFQAPVADDFARGMLPAGRGPVDDTRSLTHIRGALASVILGLKSLCTGQRAEGCRVSDGLKPD